MATPPYCPNCGAEVPERARACPGCGADETTGWSEDAEAARLGIPTEGFNYEEYVGREFGNRPPPRRKRTFLWRLVAAVLALVMLSGVLWALFVR